MKIVLITRHYPPEISGGARRPYLLSQALRELSHTVTVVTPFERKGVDEDHIYVPHPIENIGQPMRSNDQSRWTINPRFRSILRQWLLWPDPDIRWARRVRRRLQNESIEVDWLITTSPPESIHVIGRNIAAALKSKWLAECRDTWFLNPHRDILENSWIRRVLERRIAKKAFNGLDAITAVSDAVMGDIRHLIPQGTPEAIIGHFSAPMAGSDVVEDRLSMPKQDINLVHSGGFSLSDRQRKLAPLLQSLTQANRPELHLHIAGRLSPEEITLVNADYMFKVSWHGQVTLEQSRALQIDSDALLLITPEDSHALPGKFAEYVLAKRPILFSGGGDWLKLVKDKNILTSLEHGLRTISKDTPSIDPGDAAFTHLEAGKDLIAFLNKIQ